MDSELEEKLTVACSQIEKELRKCYESQGWIYFHSDEEVNKLSVSLPNLHPPNLCNFC